MSSGSTTSGLISRDFTSILPVTTAVTALPPTVAEYSFCSNSEFAASISSCSFCAWRANCCKFVPPPLLNPCGNLAFMLYSSKLFHSILFEHQFPLVLLVLQAALTGLNLLYEYPLFFCTVLTCTLYL